MKIYLAKIRELDPFKGAQEQYVVEKNILAATIKLIQKLDNPDIEILSITFISNTI